jgi:tetratricopeptide (TPR) repeat protein
MSDGYAEEVRRASSLVESGAYEDAVAVLQDLLARDISDIDKSMMCLNVAIVLDKMGRTHEALEWFAKGAGYERPHDRFYVAEQRAIYLAEKGRDAESLVLHEDLLTNPGLTEDDKQRIRHNIETLRERIARGS